jgi:hypothetical protein
MNKFKIEETCLAIIQISLAILIGVGTIMAIWTVVKVWIPFLLR